MAAGSIQHPRGGVLIAEFEGDRIERFRQYWDVVALLEGLGLLPED